MLQLLVAMLLLHHKAACSYTIDTPNYKLAINTTNKEEIMLQAYICCERLKQGCIKVIG